MCLFLLLGLALPWPSIPGKGKALSDLVNLPVSDLYFSNLKPGI